MSSFNYFRVPSKVPSRFNELSYKEIAKHLGNACDVSWDDDLLFVSQEKKIKVSSDEIEFVYRKLSETGYQRQRAAKENWI